MEITDSEIRKETIRMTIPVFFELLISSLFGMVDMVMVGNSGAPEITTPSIAAIGITNQMILLGIALSQALAVGGTTMIARYLGAKKFDKMSNVLKHLLLVCLFVLVIPIEILTQTNPEGLMTFIGAKPDAIMYGLDYFRVANFGLMFQAFNLTMFSAIRGTGDTKTPMYINTFVNLLNVVGNYILINGKLGFPKLGVTGAGISTALSHIVAFGILIVYLSKYSKILRLNIKEKFKLSRKVINNLIYIGGPAALEQLVLRAGIFLFIKLVSGLGTLVLATHQICLNIITFSYSPGQSFGISSSTLVGRSLGARDIDLADKYIKESNFFAIVSSVIIFFVFYFYGGELAALYTTDPAVIEASRGVLKLMAFAQPFQAVGFVLAGSLRGAGDTISTLIMMIVSVLFVRVSVAYVLIRYFNLGLMGAWIAMVVDKLSRFVCVLFRYKMGNWKYIKLQ